MAKLILRRLQNLVDLVPSDLRHKASKAALNQILPILPDPLQTAIIRQKVTLPKTIAPDLQFKIVDSPDELEAAFALVHKEYQRLGYCKRNFYGLRGTIHHALPTSTVLIAKHQGQVVGTLTIVRDNVLGLPLETSFSIQHLRKGGRRLAEITSLVIDPKYRRERGGSVLFPLLKLMYTYCVDYFGVDSLVVAVAPKDEYFYKSILLFKPTGETRQVQSYLGAPAVSINLDLQSAKARYKSEYEKTDGLRNFYHFFCEKELAQIKLPERRYFRVNDPVVNENSFRSIFLDKLDLASQYKPEQIEKVLALIGSSLDFNRRSLRSDVCAMARVKNLKTGHEYDAVVKDASLHGLRVCFPGLENFELSEVSLQAEVAPNEFSYIQGVQKWNHPDRGVGIQITHHDQTWQDFVAYLERHHIKNQDKPSAWQAPTGAPGATQDAPIFEVNLNPVDSRAGLSRKKNAS